MGQTDKRGTSKFQFGADLLDIAETKHKANLPKDSEKWQNALYTEYVKAGSPNPQRKWISNRLKDAFKSMSKRPVWVDFETSEWPFHNDQPMIFVSQVTLKPVPDTQDLIDEGSESYFFGLQDTGEHGEVIMVYKTQTLTRW